MSVPRSLMHLFPALSRGPAAFAELNGSAEYPGLRGTVRFYPAERGVLVLAEVSGLPEAGDSCPSGIFAFHIHSGGACTGRPEEPFADAQGHYNPENCPHPAHAGDLPPLFSNSGYALPLVLTDRFTLEEILGRTVIIHSGMDDFSSQPAGNAGKRIACGVIRISGGGKQPETLNK